MEKIILEFLNDDTKYGYLTAGEGTISVNDMYPYKSRLRMKKFIQNLAISEDKTRVGDNNSSDESETNDLIVYKMPRQYNLNKVNRLGSV